MNARFLTAALLSVPAPAPVANLCPVCEEQPSSAGHSGCCDRWCEQDYFEEQKRLRLAAPEVAR